MIQTRFILHVWIPSFKTENPQKFLIKKSRCILNGQSKHRLPSARLPKWIFFCFVFWIRLLWAVMEARQIYSSGTRLCFKRAFTPFIFVAGVWRIFSHSFLSHTLRTLHEISIHCHGWRQKQRFPTLYLQTWPQLLLFLKTPGTASPDTLAGVTIARRRVSTHSLHKSGAVLVPKGEEGFGGEGAASHPWPLCKLVYGVCKVTVNTQPGNNGFLLIIGISFFKPDEEVCKANEQMTGLPEWLLMSLAARHRLDEWMNQRKQRGGGER